MSEPELKAISTPDSEDEGEDEVLSIDFDTLSDDQLAELADEEIQRLPETDRHRIACRYLVGNELLPLGDPDRKPLGWIAKRVGIGDRQFLRLRTRSNSWHRLMEVERHRARTYVGDIALLHLRPRMLELVKQLKTATRPNERTKILQELGRTAEKLGITAVDVESQVAAAKLEGKIAKVLSYIQKNPSYIQAPQQTNDSS